MRGVYLFMLSIVLIFDLLYSAGAKDLIKAGDKYASRGDYEKALEAYNEALVLDPKDSEAACKVGWAHNRMALNSVGETRSYHFSEAANALSRALGLDTKNLMAHIELARALLFSGLAKDNWDSYTLARRVKEELDIALMLSPNNPDAHYLLGLWHRYVSRRPYLWRRPLGLGDASKKLELENLSRASELDPKRIDFLLELAKTYLELEDTSSAKKYLKGIEQLEPKDPYEKMLKGEASSLIQRLQK